MSEIKLVKRIKYAGDVHAALMELGWDAKTAAAFLDSIPDTDAVEVVRCKDCKCGKYPDSTKLVGKYVNCALYDPMPLMRSDDFCSYGERRADE